MNADRLFPHQREVLEAALKVMASDVKVAKEAIDRVAYRAWAAFELNDDVTLGLAQIRDHAERQLSHL